jgi:hypothetical protein
VIRGAMVLFGAEEPSIATGDEEPLRAQALAWFLSLPRVVRQANRLQNAFALVGLHVFLDERAGVLAVLFQECSELLRR